MARKPEYSPGGPRSAWIAGAIVVAVAWTIQIAVLLAPGEPRGPAAFDERTFHRVVIDAFAGQLPRPDLSDYAVATAPGYHLAMAAIVRLADLPLDVLRTLSGQIAVLLAAGVAWWSAKRAGAALGVPIGLSVLLVDSILPQTVLLLPEAASWLLIGLVLMLSLREGVGPRRLVLIGAIVAVLVFVRQVHLWTASIVWLVAWLGTRPEREPERLVPSLAELRIRDRLPRTLLAVLLTLPAFGVVGWLLWLWGGPVPPSFQSARAVYGGSVHSGGNPATPALVLSVFGMLGPMLMLPMLGVLRASPELRGRALRLAALGAALGLVASIATATTADAGAGRWTGLWDQTARFPSVAERSVLISGLCVVGGALLVGGLALLRSRDRLVLLGAIVAFTAAQSANYQAWIRYVEPMVLLVLTALVALSVGRARVRPRWTLVGPWLAVAFMAARSLPDVLAGFR